MDWIAIDKRVKKDLIMIMNRSLIPIKLSSAYIFTVNLESFVKVNSKEIYFYLSLLNGELLCSKLKE